MENVNSTIPTKKYQSLSKGLGTAGIILDEQTLFVNRLSGRGADTPLFFDTHFWNVSYFFRTYRFNG